MPQYDFLVIGSGIAGLSYATKLARHFDQQNEAVKIAVITKVQADETNTKYAQGGIAAVWTAEDSFEKHIDDTMVAGGQMSKRNIVEIVVREAPERIEELINYVRAATQAPDGRPVALPDLSDAVTAPRRTSWSRGKNSVPNSTYFSRRASRSHPERA